MSDQCLAIVFAARSGGLSSPHHGDAHAYTVYVSNEKDNSITVIDSATLEVHADRSPWPATARHQADQGRQISC